MAAYRGVYGAHGHYKEVAAEKAEEGAAQTTPEPRSDTVELVELELATRRSRLEAGIATTAAPAGASQQ